LEVPADARATVLSHLMPPAPPAAATARATARAFIADAANDDDDAPNSGRRRGLRSTFWLQPEAEEAGSAAGEPRLQDYVSPTAAEFAGLRALALQNVTTFTRDEALNPLFFFEQALRLMIGNL
jgi:hypothetical protein